MITPAFWDAVLHLHPLEYSRPAHDQVEVPILAVGKGDLVSAPDQVPRHLQLCEIALGLEVQQSALTDPAYERLRNETTQIRDDSATCCWQAVAISGSPMHQ